jgi:hypothetical protein
MTYGEDYQATSSFYFGASTVTADLQDKELQSSISYKLAIHIFLPQYKHTSYTDEA